MVRNAGYQFQWRKTGAKKALIAENVGGKQILFCNCTQVTLQKKAERLTGETAAKHTMI